jgi:hypothetical protein
MKNGTSKNLYEGLANTIWEKDRSSREDRLRWHSNGNNYFEEKSLGLTDLFEDVIEVLDIESNLVGISHETWQENYLQNPFMMAAMARCIYENLKQYNRYSFETLSSDLVSQARKYKLEVLNVAV